MVKKVLIVDDEKTFISTLADGLEPYKADFSLFTASNGREAIKILGERKIDLIVTDLKMPKVDGFRLLAHVMAKYPNISVIVMTAFGNPQIEKRLQQH